MTPLVQIEAKKISLLFAPEWKMKLRCSTYHKVSETEICASTITDALGKICSRKNARMTAISRKR